MSCFSPPWSFLCRSKAGADKKVGPDEPPKVSRDENDSRTGQKDMDPIAQAQLDVYLDTRIVTLAAEAAESAEGEREMGLFTALRKYKKAVLWSMFVSLTLIMEGYDTVLLNSLYAQPQFEEYFGTLGEDGNHTIAAAWKTGLSNAPYVGQILGLMGGAEMIDRFGCRTAMMIALTLMNGVIFLPFFARKLSSLLVGQILCGIPWGTFQTLAPTYASEVAPLRLRPFLTTYINLCWLIGQLLGSGVCKAALGLNKERAFRIPFALQWLWPAPIMVGVLFAPESPWWLVRKGRIVDARKALIRLGSSHEEDVTASLAQIEETNLHEEEVSAGTSYKDCFKGVDRRRTLIGCMTWTTQALCGSTFTSFSTLFFKQAGIPTSDAFSFSLGQYAIGIVGTFFAWGFMGQKYGRSKIYLYGCLVLFVLLLATALIGIAPRSNEKAGKAVVGLILVWIYVYNCTVGPVCYAIIAEISSTRLRSKTVAISRLSYIVVSVACTTLTSYQLTDGPSGWDWGAKSAGLWAATCGVCVIWIFFCLPECEGKTPMDIDVLFEEKIKARHFRKVKGAITRRTLAGLKVKTGSRPTQRMREIREIVKHGVPSAVASPAPSPSQSRPAENSSDQSPV